MKTRIKYVNDFGGIQKSVTRVRLSAFFMGFSKHRTPTVDGMFFRRCLSGGGDIFSKSVERQGGANRTFKASGCCHGWQLEPCPCGLEPLLTFRQKIPTGRPYIKEGCSVRRERSWGLRQPYVTVSHILASLDCFLPASLLY